MGTRGLTMVVSNGKTKIAQYGQWDHYPSGQGVEALHFLHDVDLTKFVLQLDKCKFVDDEKQKEIDEFLVSIDCANGWMTTEKAVLYNKQYPFLTRDHGAKILSLVNDAQDETILLQDSTTFAGNGSCEWAYVIDLDKGTFEVYTCGFDIPSENERFFYLYDELKNLEEYQHYKPHPVVHVKTYSLEDLPTEDEFIDELNKLTSEDEEEDEVVNAIQDVLKTIENDGLVSMDESITLTVSQLREIFVAGSEFEKQTIEFELDEREEIDAPDFGDFIEKFGVKINT